MSNPGLLSNALAFLPNWWQAAAEPTLFDTLLAGWVRACGWRAGGFIWQADGQPITVKAVPADNNVPVELSEVARQIQAGAASVLIAAPAGTTRVYAPVQFPGRSFGLVWAERTAAEVWSDTERAYLALTGKTLERSPAALALVGPAIDTERLNQRLADAAIIAGRIAHDFDNILTGIMGFTDLTVGLLPPGSQPAAFVAEIAKVGQRGITFTQQLHQLSRSGQARPTPGSVVATLAREETRIKSVMHPTLAIEKDFPLNTPAVAVEAGLLQTALGHLFENAVEACPKGGTVRLSAHEVNLTEADARNYLGAVGLGPHLLITISDTGSGIKPEVRKRLFAEPLFTTKVKHRGLGLAVVYRIVSVHRGGIQIDSVPSPGTGTVVRVVLPLALARPSVAVPTPPPAMSGLRVEAIRAGGIPKTSPVRG